MTEERNKENTDNLSIILFFIGIIILLIIVYLLFSNISKIRGFINERDTYSLAISTNPDGAAIILDENIVGRSPVTVQTFPGAHVLTVKKEGYIPQSHAFDLSRDQYTSGKEWKRELVKQGSPWSYNFTLEKLSIQPDTSANDTTQQGYSLSEVKKEIEDLRSLILSNPEQSLSYGVIKNRIDSIERLIDALKEQATFSNNLAIAFYSTLVVVLITLASLILSSRKN